VALGRVERLTDLAVDRSVTIAEGRGLVDERQPPASRPPVGGVLATIAVEQGLAAAVTRYRELRRDEPEARDYGPEALAALTLNLLRQGRVEEAVGIQELAVEEFPRSGPARQLLVRLYGYLGRGKAARVALVELVESLDELQGLSAIERETLRNDLGFQRKHLAVGADRSDD
jgi:hypothetical protein